MSPTVPPSLRPLAGETFVRIPRQRSADPISGLWFASPRKRGLAVVSHGSPGRSFIERDRVITEALVRHGFSTLRVQYRPVTWIRPPSRAETDRRFPMARAAIRWALARCPDVPLLLAGGSSGATLSGCLATEFRARGALLVSPPVYNPNLGTSLQRWAGPLKAFRGSRLLVVGDRDLDWAPLDRVRSLVGRWNPPPDLEIIREGTHNMKGYETPLREAIARWLNDRDFMERA